MRRQWSRGMAAALLVGLLCTARVAAQGLPPLPEAPTREGGPSTPPGGSPFDGRFAAILPGEADVPAALRLDLEASGPFAVPGLSGHLVTYVHGGADSPSDLTTLPALPPGTVVLLKSSVQVLTREAMGPEALDAAIDGLQTATAAGGAQIDSTTSYVGLPLGEDSRAQSLHYQLHGTALASTAIVFRRADVVAALNVVATGDDPPFQPAQALAQLVDARLVALTTGAETSLPTALPSAPLTPALTPPGGAPAMLAGQ